MLINKIIKKLISGSSKILNIQSEFCNEKKEENNIKIK